MLCLFSGLLMGAVVCLFVVGGSIEHGYPIEVATVRGLVGFMGVSLLAYVGELVVATAPPRPREVRTPARLRDALPPATPPALAADNDRDDDADGADMRQAA